ncbi:MAG TPA: beta-L-arabinofuranosidase domain-containing protein, partial [Anaerolineae bacterium]
MITLQPHTLQAVALKDVDIADPFWTPKLDIMRRVTLPDVFAKLEHDGALINFDRVRDGQTGGHGGPPWYDGLLYETMRAAADVLALHEDAALAALLEGYISRIAAAAALDPDGYINTFTQLEMPTCHFGLNGGNLLWQHDIYNAGALVDAAVHYFRATGRSTLLKVAARMTNHMADVMGPAPKKNIVPAHPLAEEAVIKLYQLFTEQPGLRAEMGFDVDETRYLHLVEFWLENRGNHEGRAPLSMPQCGPAYAQDHLPLLKQETAEGHAVRAALLYTGLVSAAMVNQRADYYRAALTLWNNAVHRKMHITGGVGSNQAYEGFGPDYFLPNDAYLETCAAVGMGFFHQAMALAFADGRFADELER